MSTLRRPRAVLACIVVIGTVLGSLAACSLIASAPAVSTVGKVGFDNALSIPPLAPSTVQPDGTRVFELTAQTGQSKFVPGAATDTWGFSQSYLGPTLRAERGEKVEVKIHNQLAETTTVHWHGMHLPPAMDGGPHQPIAPGTEWDPSWTIDQPAATLWYHPHPHGATEEHVRNGLAGMFILDDPAEEALPLPRQYGVDDIPLIVQDVAFDDHNQLVKRDGGYSGALGDHILVNGTPSPHLDVSTTSVRLRLLNASPARIYNFAFSDGRRFDQIASDGGLLETPNPTSALQLSPGERAEIVVGLTPGEKVVLRSTPPELGDTSAWNGRNGGEDKFDILQLRAADQLQQEATVPAVLASIPRLDPTDATETRDFELDDHEINDEKMEPNRIDAVVTKGSTEVWNVTNSMGSPHNFHIHDVQFQVVSVDGAPPPPELSGWKDTVYLSPDKHYRLIMQFTDYSDPDHPYMFHCHLLQHEDAGMMGQFLVVDPGTAPAANWDVVRPGEDDDHHGDGHDDDRQHGDDHDMDDMEMG